MGNKNGTYVWRVLVYDGNGHQVPKLTRVFTSKISAMNYASKMQSTEHVYYTEWYYRGTHHDKKYGYYRAKLEKWFGD